jgi:hypothetical protein
LTTWTSRSLILARPIWFTDLDSGESGFVYVRMVPGGIGLTVSFKNDGDLERVVDDDVARAISARIAAAVDAPH